MTTVAAISEIRAFLAKPTVKRTEFWRRWHLSLSFWFRDYLYIPLGGGRPVNMARRTVMASARLAARKTTKPTHTASRV